MGDPSARRRTDPRELGGSTGGGPADSEPHYLLQQLNLAVFPDYELLMRNAVTISRHVNARSSSSPPKDADFVRDGEGRVFRLLRFVANSVPAGIPPSLPEAREAAIAFGEFDAGSPRSTRRRSARRFPGSTTPRRATAGSSRPPARRRPTSATPPGATSPGSPSGRARSASSRIVWAPRSCRRASVTTTRRRTTSSSTATPDAGSASSTTTR